MTQGSRRAARAAVLGVVAALLVLAAAAFAVTPTPSAAYKGHLDSNAQTAVTFAVSKDGKFVVNMRVSPRPPDRCGSGGPPPQQSSPPAPISNGAFTAAVTDTGVAHTVVSRLKVTGRFLPGGKVSGVVNAVPPADPKCGGAWRYSATTP